MDTVAWCKATHALLGLSSWHFVSPCESPQASAEPAVWENLRQMKLEKAIERAIKRPKPTWYSIAPNLPFLLTLALACPHMPQRFSFSSPLSNVHPHNTIAAFVMIARVAALRGK